MFRFDVRPFRLIASLLVALLVLAGCADLPGVATDEPASPATEAADAADAPADDAPTDDAPADDGATPGTPDATPTPTVTATPTAPAPDDAAANAAPVAVTLDEWSVDPAPDTVAAGALEFTATNAGEYPHELVVVRGTAADLPLDDDGAVDEDLLGDDAMIAEIEDLEAGESGTATVDLEAGDYTLLCNIVHVDGGIVEPHYEFGMVHDFTVTAD